jgi:hypothetical protein
MINSGGLWGVMLEEFFSLTPEGRRSISEWWGLQDDII